jgi:carbohydrate kinase (thermoresistant glucokinase family)
VLILVMGVTAAGKTTVGRQLAERLGLPFHDADDFHPPENRSKMAANLPLNDDDRRPWLERLSECAADWERTGGAVLGCSALKRAYRELLFRHVSSARVVFLEITREQAVARLEQRRGKHAFIADYDRVLAGQFADLEVPEPAIRIPAVLAVPEIVERAAAALFRDGFSDPNH